MIQSVPFAEGRRRQVPVRTTTTAKHCLVYSPLEVLRRGKSCTKFAAKKLFLPTAKKCVKCNQQPYCIGRWILEPYRVLAAKIVRSAIRRPAAVVALLYGFKRLSFIVYPCLLTVTVSIWIARASSVVVFSFDFPSDFTTMVPGKGKYANISKGKGASNAKGASTSKSKDGKRERVSEVEDSDEDEHVTLPDVRFVDYAKTLPRFTASMSVQVSPVSAFLFLFPFCLFFHV